MKSKILNYDFLYLMRLVFSFCSLSSSYFCLTQSCVKHLFPVLPLHDGLSYCCLEMLFCRLVFQWWGGPLRGSPDPVVTRHTVIYHWQLNLTDELCTSRALLILYVGSDGSSHWAVTLLLCRQFAAFQMITVPLSIGSSLTVSSWHEIT